MKKNKPGQFTKEVKNTKDKAEVRGMNKGVALCLVAVILIFLILNS